MSCKRAGELRKLALTGLVADHRPHGYSRDGAQVVDRTAGKGPVLPLVHAIAGSSTTWRYVAPPLAEQFTVLAPDLPGQGDPDNPGNDYCRCHESRSERDVSVTIVRSAQVRLGASSGSPSVPWQFCVNS